MQIKNIIVSRLFAVVTLAVPVAAADTNLEKRDGKCNAQIYVDASKGLALPQHATWKWNIDVTGNSGLLGHWDGTSPDGTIKVPSGNGIDLWISGKPARATKGQEGVLKLEYNSRSWVSNTCEYLFKEAGPSNGVRHAV